MSIYNADGKINITEVDGSSYTGLYAADGSINVVLDDGVNFGLYHPCGAYRVNSDDGETNLDPSGAYYYNRLMGIGAVPEEAPAGITFVGDSVGSAGNGSNASINLLNIPLLPGDFLLIIGSCNDRTATAGESATNGTTPLSDNAVGVNDIRARISYKFYEEDDTTITITNTANSFDACSGIALAFRGVDTDNPFDAVTTSASGSASAPNPPSITTVTDNAMVVAIGASIDLDGSPGTVDGYSDTIVVTGNDTVDSTTAAAYKIKATAGAEDPGAWSTWNAPTAWVAFTAALRPVA